MGLEEWVRTHAAALASLDPDDRLDDLEPFGAIVGDARVVAIGEGAHFVREFSRARARLVRFLIERCGFTLVALEFGFSEGFALDRWLQEAGDDDELRSLVGPLAGGLHGDLLRWLRRRGSRTARIVGIDLPTTYGLGRDLEPVASYLRSVDQDAVPVIESALAIVARLPSGSAAVTAPAWGRLDPAERDALTAALARVRHRLLALEALHVSRSDQTRFDRARQSLESACHADYMLGAMHALFGGTGMPADTSVRERYLADSLLWPLERAGPETRVILIAHNNHIQKTAIVFDDYLAALPMGHYLARALGSAYRAVALTHTADQVPEMSSPDPRSEIGFTVAPMSLEPPEPGTIEAVVASAGLAGAITLTDLRSAPPTLDGIRTQSATLRTPVVDAFDAVLASPTATIDFPRR